MTKQEQLVDMLEKTLKGKTDLEKRLAKEHARPLSHEPNRSNNIWNIEAECKKYEGKIKDIRESMQEKGL